MDHGEVYFGGGGPDSEVELKFNNPLGYGISYVRSAHCRLSAGELNLTTKNFDLVGWGEERGGCGC